MRRVCIASALLLFACAVAGAGEQQPKAVVELFTSQGCSSCPPADGVLAQMAGDPEVVALSLPVDYWDYLGWKDTLARPGFSKRQKAYADQRGDRQVYTPQAVINGVVHVLGSDRQAIEQAAASSRAKGVMSVPVVLSEADQQIRIEVGEAPAGWAGTVWLLPITRQAAVTIGRGENKDRSVVYCNVVRTMTKVGEWTGQASRFEVPLSAAQVASADSYAVLLQAGSLERPGAILGAAIKAQER
jgi:hypothetical protein